MVLMVILCIASGGDGGNLETVCIVDHGMSSPVVRSARKGMPIRVRSEYVQTEPGYVAVRITRGQALP